MTKILQKLDLLDRTQAAVYALSRGWVRLHESTNSH
jgi:DNA-binding NarL/FixJ family response regulator